MERDLTPAEIEALSSPDLYQLMQQMSPVVLSHDLYDIGLRKPITIGGERGFRIPVLKVALDQGLVFAEDALRPGYAMWPMDIDEPVESGDCESF